MANLTQLGPLLPALVNITYNGYQFGPFTKTEINGRQVWSTDGRTIIYTVYRIRVQSTITAFCVGSEGQDDNPDDSLDDSEFRGGGEDNPDAQEGNQGEYQDEEDQVICSTDDQLDDIRTLLEQPAAPLIIEGLGWGTFAINDPGSGESAVDVVWGPKPQILSFHTTGAGMAAKIVWECEVAIPECTGAAYQFALMEMNTKYQFTTDGSGYSKRAFSGFIRIPQTRLSPQDRTLFDSADNYRDSFTPPPLENFRRTTADFQLSDDKCRIDFNFVDEEMPPNIPPPGIISAKASHSIESQLYPGTSWTGTISASYEVAKGQPRGIAFGYFLDLLQSRIQYALDNATNGQGSQSASVIVTRIAMSEPEIYGRESANFSATYTFVCDLEHIFAASGLWTAVPDSDWNLWSTSLAGTLYASQGRGQAGLGFDTSMDLIVDLCQPSEPAVQGSGSSSGFQTGNAPQFTNPYPDPQTSFLDYQLHAVLEYDDHRTELKALPQAPIQTQGPSVPISLVSPDGQDEDEGPEGDEIDDDEDGFIGNYPAQPSNSIAQQRAAPTIYLHLEGRAMRAGYKINAPQLTSIGGANATPYNEPGQQGFRCWQYAQWFGVPIYAATWSQRYLLDAVPSGDLDVPPNPMGVG
jgi:hypothetical protein